MVNKFIFIAGLIFTVSGVGAANFVFAQSQSPCSSSVSIIDTSQAQSGTIFVLSNSAQAFFTIINSVTSELIYKGDGYAWSREGVIPGTYTITWSPVSGCGTPSSETKTTDTRGSIAFAGNYKNLNAPAGYGIIDIKTNLNKSTTFTVSGPTTQTVQGTGYTWGSAPAGTYTVTYGVVDGYSTPPPETKILNVGSTLNFYGSYIVKQIPVQQTTTSDVQYFIIESKPMSGVNAYVDGVFVGKTPARATAHLGSRAKIRCSFDGYEDFNGEYRASDPGSGVIVVDPKTTCFITVKKGISSSPAPQQSLSPQEQPRTTILPQNRIEQTTSPVAYPVQAKPKGFFSRFWQSILSLFQR